MRRTASASNGAMVRIASRRNSNGVLGMNELLLGSRLEPGQRVRAGVRTPVSETDAALAGAR